MKIIIENFGPIYKYEFDLEKDFHIIYGKNNIGKSYAISAVYLILKAFKEMKEEFDSDNRFIYSEILNI